MASVINTNMASLYAQKNLSGAQSALSTSVERLSSGLRINRAKDDVAGLGISEKLKSQIVSLNQGIRNANDAVSMVQTAEGSLSEVSNILQRMKELAVQGRNESLSDIQRTYIADELISLKKEVNAIAERTTFNGMSLLKNALRTQVADAMGATNKATEGAAVLDGISIAGLKVQGANVGTYTLSTRKADEVVAASVVSQAVPVAEEQGEFLDRTVTINAGDVYEGAKITITVEGADTTNSYSVVVGQDDDATSVAANLVTKLAKTYTAGVSSSGAVVTFDDQLSLGTTKITVKAESLAALKTVDSMRSTVDGPYATIGVDRNIRINDFDVVEGRKFTVRIGNPNTFTEFSTYAGAGATASDIADKLEDLMDAQFSSTSSAGGVITMGSAGNYGMAQIDLIIEETQAAAANLTLSTVNDEYGVGTARTVTINKNDLIEGRVLSLTVNGKEYAYKVTADDMNASDTANTVAYKLSNLLSADFRTQDGTVNVGSGNGSFTLANVALGAGSYETNTVTFSAISVGDSITVGGLTFTASKNLTAIELAEEFDSLSDGAGAGLTSTVTGGGTFTGTLDGWASANNAGAATVVFTRSVTGNVPSISVTNTPAIATSVETGSWPGITTTDTGGDRTIDLNFDTLLLNAGDAITIAGLKYVATATNTGTQVAAAFAGVDNGDVYSALTPVGGLGYFESGTVAAGAAYDAPGATASGHTLTFTQTGAQTIAVAVTLTPRTSVAASAAETSAGSLATESNTVTFASGLAIGDSMTVGGLRFTATSTVSEAQLAAAFSNLKDGATQGVGVLYGYYEGTLRGFSSGAQATVGGDEVVTFTASIANTNVPNLTASANRVAADIERSANVITFTSDGAKLGTAAIDFKAYSVSDGGLLTLRAESDTGLVDAEQTINIGTIGAGQSKLFSFDQLGVSFSLVNSRSSSVGSELFATYGSRVDTLEVSSAMDGKALFQVGADVRDTVEISGFKDVRIMEANKNDDAGERQVFSGLHETLKAIEAGNVDESIFGTLETQVEEAITTVSTFRSNFGAQQNRIDYAIANLQAQSENITEANSRIRDTDYAAETANLTKTQIMQQAATAMLAQANQMPNVILALLK